MLHSKKQSDELVERMKCELQMKYGNMTATENTFERNRSRRLVRAAEKNTIQNSNDELVKLMRFTLNRIDSGAGKRFSAIRKFFWSWMRPFRRIPKMNFILYCFCGFGTALILIPVQRIFEFHE